MTEQDPRLRPDDPAGTKPKVDPESLLPARRASLEPAVEGTAVEDPGAALLPPGSTPAAPPARLDADPSVPAPHAPRFQFLQGALIALGVASVATVALVVTGFGRAGDGGASSAAAWSPWHPTASGLGAARQIADHVGREYHLSNGEQLVAVTGGPMQIEGLPLTIAVRQPASRGGAIALIDGKGLLYRLCGLGARCAIPTGKPSRQRHLLLRREALELALYSFRYTDADNVVAFLPPPPGKAPSQALLFRRRDVDPELARPLAATLARRAPAPDNAGRSPDAGFVQRFTLPRLFSFSFTQANQDNRAFLVLQPPA